MPTAPRQTFRFLPALSARREYQRGRRMIGRSLRRAPLLFTLLVLALLPFKASAQPAPGPDPGRGEATDPRDAAGMISSWTPEYSAPLVLPMGDGAFSLSLDGDAMWVATETKVSHLSGGVWREPEPLPEDARAFALTVADGRPWAFGYEGGVWKRQDDGTWRALPRPTGADLLAAANRGRRDVWAAGYDYIAEQGVLAHWDGDVLSSMTWDTLRYRQFTALAVDAEGTLWAGGCGVDGETGAPLLLRLPPGEVEWEEVPVSLEVGCIYHMAFAPSGPLPAGIPRGVAAGGTDILTWDGVSWTASDRPPLPDSGSETPVEGLRWMRVGLGVDELGLGSAWALAGVPTWRGYASPQQPWRLSDGVWSPDEIDDLGLIATFGGDGAPSPIPPLDMTSDGHRIWAMGQVRDETSTLIGIATMISLNGDGARLAHPLALSAADIAVESGGSAARVHHSARRSGPPLIGSPGTGSSDKWPAAPGFRFAPAVASRVLIDIASPGVGWAVQTGRTPSGPDRGVESTLSAWRLIDDAWLPMQSPTDTLQLRALPDGGAWARALHGGGLITFDGAGWSPVSGAPRLSTAKADCRRVLAGSQCDTLVAPFDVVQGGEGLVGWVGGADGRMYRWDGSRFEVARGAERGEVIDLQLTTPESGWALTREAGPVAGRSRGALLRLEGKRWSEVRTFPLPTPRGRERLYDIEWHLLAAVDEREAWLAGTATVGDSEVPLLVRWLDGSAPTVFFECEVGGLSARVTEDGSEVWLIGPGRGRGCVPNAGRRPVGHVRPGAGEWPSGPTLSRISMSLRRGEVFLPSVVRTGMTD